MTATETLRARDRGVPAREVILHPRAIDRRRESTILAPRLRELRLVLPHTGAESREKRRAERRRFDELGPRDLDAEHVALELHQQIVRRRATVDLQRAKRAAGVALHRAQDVDVL